MDCKDYLKHWFGRAWKDIDGDVEGLTDEELDWVPQGGKHSIKALYYHMIQAVDGWQVGTLEGKTFDWEHKFGDWESATLPSLGDLVEYRDEVHRRFMAFLDALSPDDLSAKVKVFGGDDEVPRWWVFGHLLEHFHRHWGQIRLMLRMMGKDPVRI